MKKFDFNVFKNISETDISPIYSWLWNSEITKELIEKQTDEMVEQGIRGSYILPMPKEFRPNSMITPMSPDYLSDEFFELVKYAISCGEKKGIAMWLYDEGGWPSGNACGQIVEKYPDCRAKVFEEKKVVLKAEDMLKEEGIIAVFDENFKRIELPFKAEKPTAVFVYYVKTLDAILTDLLDERVVDEFISSTHERYKECLGEKFGKSVKAIFTDEPLIPYPYYIKDTEAFERKCGYNFADNIPALFHKGFNDEFKAKYIEYCAGLFEERYMKKIHKWCKDNGIAFTGHMDGDDRLLTYEKQMGNALRQLRNMDIPGVDVILRHIFPGSEENNFFPRFASSAAHQTGGRLAVSESFAVSGSGLTFDRMRYVCNYQLVRGINIINFMSVTSGRDNSLSAQWRPHFVPELPEKNFRKDFNEYLSRMMYLCRLGEVCADTALYMPMEDMWRGSETAEREFFEAGKLLEENQIYFDIADSDEKYHGMYKHIFKADNISDLKKYALVDCDSRDIRVMKRKLENDSVYILFNESTEVKTVHIDFPEKKKGYILNCIDGTAQKLESNEFCFCGGEAVAVIFTDEEMECCDEKTFGEELARINNFDFRVIKTVEYDGEKLVVSDGGEVSESFSGIGEYKTEFEWDEAGDIGIKLKNIRYYAEIRVNGVEAGKLFMEPYKLVIPKDLLKPRNELCITVANTAANTFFYADYTSDPKKVGPYNARTLEFEKDSLGFGLDEVILYRVK